MPSLKEEIRARLKEKYHRQAKSRPSDFARLSLGFQADPWQKEFLDSNSKRIILNCSRQSGKSTTTAALALYEAVTRPRSMIVLDSKGLRQSQELMLKFEDFLERLPIKAIDSDTKLSKRFANGSRVVALPGSEDTIRGISAVTLFIEDEASRVPDALYNSIRPMLAVSNGRLILMSTPFGKRGHFHKVWTEGQGWERYEIPAEDCPRISAEFLDEERRDNPWFEQEYHCKFMETDDQLFNYDQVAAAFSAGVAPLEFSDEELGKYPYGKFYDTTAINSR